MNNIDYSDLVSLVSQRLMRLKEKNDGILAEGMIEKTLDRELSFDDYEVDREKVLADLEKKFATLIGFATSLRSNEKRDKPDKPWVAQKLNDGELNWRYWHRYRSYLLKNGWDGPVVGRLDQTTSEILDSMMPPEEFRTWDQRGLIVGHVQSGKTAN